MVTFKPLACKSFARDAAIMPLPKEEVTPPVTKMYLAIKNNLPASSYVDQGFKKYDQRKFGIKS